jgi:hypothetical protein
MAMCGSGCCCGGMKTGGAGVARLLQQIEPVTTTYLQCRKFNVLRPPSAQIATHESGADHPKWGEGERHEIT